MAYKESVLGSQSSLDPHNDAVLCFAGIFHFQARLQCSGDNSLPFEVEGKLHLDRQIDNPDLSGQAQLSIKDLEL